MPFSINTRERERERERKKKKKEEEEERKEKEKKKRKYSSEFGREQQVRSSLSYELDIVLREDWRSMISIHIYYLWMLKGK